MSYGIWLILAMVVVMVVTFAKGASISGDAETILQQIYSGFWYIISALMLVGICIVHMLGEIAASRRSERQDNDDESGENAHEK